MSIVKSQMFGFTLIELLISISILGAMLALGVPAFRNYNKQVVFDSLADTIAAQLADARTLSLAPESAKPAAVIAYGVQFDATVGSYSLNRYSALAPAVVASQVKQVIVPSPVVFDRVPTDPILFPISLGGAPASLPTGGAVIVLRNSTLSQRPTRTLTVNPVTGQVSVQ